MAALGSLVVSLEANMAKFTSDMGKAAYQTEQAMQQMQRHANATHDMLVGMAQGIAGALSVGLFVDLVRGSIEAADTLRDMSQKTGIAVETLNGMGLAAHLAGGHLDGMVAAVGKLNKSIVEAGHGGNAQADAFKALGINVKDASGDLKTADVVMAEMADKFETYADGPEKVAIAMALMGKSGADQIPVLNEGGDAMRANIEYAKQYSGVTTDLANASDEFNDTLGKLHVQQQSFANTLTAALLPVLQAVADETLNAAEQSNGFSLAANIARTVLETFVAVGAEVAYVFKSVGTEIGGITAQLAALASGDLKGFSVIGDAMKADADRARIEHDKFVSNILIRPPASVTTDGQPARQKGAAPRLPARDKDGNTDDPAKQKFEGHLKSLESAMEKERAQIDFGNKYVQELRNQDRIGLVEYNNYRKAALDAGLEVTIKAYDAEIAAAERYQAYASKQTEKAAAQNKIDELRSKKAKAIQDAGNADLLLTLDQSKAQSDLNKSVEEWNRTQTAAADQRAFTNSLLGKSTLEVERLTNARRLELDMEEKIRAAKEKGTITEESIAKFRLDSKIQQDAINRAAVQGVGGQVRRSLMKPEDSEKELHDNRIKDLQAFKALELANVAEGNRLIEEENARHQQMMSEMQMRTDQNMVNMMANSTDQLYSMMKQAGMEQSALGQIAFLASRALGVAQIILSTNVAAATALMPPPLGLGPIAGVPFASAIKAMGYASAGMTAGIAIAGMREKGGPVWGGGAFIVGEKGPEIFKPTGSGTIIPNSALGGASSAPMTLTIVNQTSAKIGQVTEQRISPTERALIIQEAVSAQASALSDPNSRMSRSMGRNYAVQRSR